MITRLQGINAAIQRCTDKKLLRLLNRAWWKEFKMVRLIFCGDRDWSDDKAIEEVMLILKDALGPFVVIEGECRGADLRSRAIANRHGLDVDRNPADWKRFKSGAGPIRNNVMLIDKKADGVVAFHDNLLESSGTRNMVEQATQKGVPVWVSQQGLMALTTFIQEVRKRCQEMSKFSHKDL